MPHNRTDQTTTAQRVLPQWPSDRASVPGLQLLLRLCLLFVMLLVGGPAAAQVRNFRLSHQFSADIDARDRAARLFAQEVTKRVPNITFSVLANSALKIPPPEQLDALLDGRIELAVYPFFYGSKRIPEFSIGLLPGIPSDVPTANLLKGTDFHRRLQEMCEQHGVHILGWWWLAGGIVSRETDISGPATVKGLRARGGDAGFDLMLSAAEGNVVTLTSNEMAGRMRDGTLDVAMTSFESFVSFRVFESAKAATFGGYGLWTSFQPLIMSKAAWDRLSETDQEAFTQAATVADTFFVTTQLEAEQAARDAFTKAGARVRTMEFADYADWLRIAQRSSWRQYRERSPEASNLLNAMMQSLIASGSTIGSSEPPK